MKKRYAVALLVGVAGLFILRGDPTGEEAVKSALTGRGYVEVIEGEFRRTREDVSCLVEFEASGSGEMQSLSLSAKSNTLHMPEGQAFQKIYAAFQEDTAACLAWSPGLTEMLKAENRQGLSAYSAAEAYYEVSVSGEGRTAVLRMYMGGSEGNPIGHLSVEMDP